MPTVSISQRVYVDVDVDANELLQQLEQEEVLDVLGKHLEQRGVDTPIGMGDGDPTRSRLIEQAFLAAKSLPDCPKPIRDLFYLVHGRAMA
jgi:hypothetical protein